MNRKFIIDKEINLNNGDFLQTKIYSENLKRVIDNTEENRVFTIGLFGPWGSGKSSIIETCKNNFDEKKVKFITYDAWQYANDSFRRMLLRKVRKDLGFEETELLKKFYENESAEIGNKFELSTTRLLWILSALIVLIVILWVFPITMEWKMPLYSIFTILSIVVTIFSGAFHQLKVSITKPLFFAPEQFEDCFKQMASKSLKKYNWVHEKLFVLAGNKSIRNLDKLIIVIDNIDRCNNDVAYNLLTDIKTFLGSEDYNIVFVIPVDDEALKKHLFKANSKTDEYNAVKEKEEFLRKFFNVTIRIKPYLQTDMFEFAKKINNHYNLGFNNETLNLTTKEYSANPRRVIQLFNNLTSELSNYSNEFVNENETLICAILIMREEFDSYYQKVVNASLLFINGEFGGGEENNERLGRFIRITRNAVKNANPILLNRILTNSENIFSNLSAEHKDSIDTFNKEKIIELLTPDQIDIFDYLIHVLTRIKSNNLHKDLTQYFDILCESNISNKIVYHINHRLNEYFLDKIDFIIRNTESHDNMCLYALSQEEQGIGQLKNSIVDLLLSYKVEESFVPNLLSSIVKNFTDTKSSRKIVDFYFDTYKLVNSSIKLTPLQYNDLISSRFMERSIQQLDQLFNETYKYNDLLDILKNKTNISKETYYELIKRINSISGDFHEGEHGQILTTISLIEKLLTSIKYNYKESNSELLLMYQRIYQILEYPNPTNPNNRSLYLTFDLIGSSIEDTNAIEILIRLAFDFYVLSDGEIEIVKELERLNDSRALINELINDLITKDQNFDGFVEYILTDKNLDDVLSLELTMASFLLKSEDSFVMNPNSARVKLDEILEFANSNNSTNAFDFCEKVMIEPVYKDMISSIIITKSIAFINRLPHAFIALAVSQFNNENYLDFKDNLPLLEAVSKEGDSKQIGNLVKLLTPKIDDKNQIVGIIPILLNLNKIEKSDKDIIKSHLNKFFENHSADLSEDNRPLFNALSILYNN